MTYADEHVIEITGMPGVGKTALAAFLAARVAPSERVFWHSFHSGQGGDTLIWALAAFLAQNGQPDVWALLQRSRQGESQAPPSDLLLNYLVPLLDGHGFLLCLDDFHYVDDDPQLDELVQRLRPLLASGALDLVITSRRAPSFAILSEVELLTGLTCGPRQPSALNPSWPRRTSRCSRPRRPAKNRLEQPAARPQL